LRQSFDQSEKSVSAFGERLRRERETRGISLDEIAANTKIGKRFLRALEEEQFELLPGGIFNRGYVRAYAKYVGIDDDQAVAEYLTAAGEQGLDAHLVPEQSGGVRTELTSRSGDARSGFSLITVLILLVVIAGAAGGWQLYRQRVRERAQPAVKVTQPASTAASAAPQAVPGATGNHEASPAVAAATKPAATQNTPDAGPAGAAAGAATANDATAPFEVTVRAKDRAWVSIKSDGKILVRGIIYPPEVKTVRASNQIVFWTGNAGVVELSFNGQNVPLTGGDNDEQVLVFNSHGLQPHAAAQ